MGKPTGLMFVLAAVAVAAGVFGGQYLWHTYQVRQAAAAAAAAQAAAEAEASTPMAKQRVAVLEKLHHPESAVFRNVRQSKVDPSMWCGEVNARNALGGMVGFTRYTATVLTEGKKDILLSASIDPAGPGRDAQGPLATMFQEEWRQLCEAPTP
jgi:hypothetical protein